MNSSKTGNLINIIHHPAPVVLLVVWLMMSHVSTSISVILPDLSEQIGLMKPSLRELHIASSVKATCQSRLPVPESVTELDPRSHHAPTASVRLQLLCWPTGQKMAPLSFSTAAGRSPSAGHSPVHATANNHVKAGTATILLSTSEGPTSVMSGAWWPL